MRLEAKKYVFDIQRAAALIAEFTSGLSLEEYQRRPMVRAAVEREFEIVGEALTQVFRNNLSHSVAQVGSAACCFGARLNTCIHLVNLHV